MARRKDHSRDELKDLVLEKAWNIVGQAGFEGVTARAIAKAIGYAPGTIYNLFDSMDDLYLQVNARTLDRLYEALNASVSGGSDQTPAENMKVMAQAYMTFAHDYRSHWMMLFHYRMPDGAKPGPWYEEKIERLFAPLESLMEPLFPQGQDRRRKVAARVLWASVHGLCFLQETGKLSVVDDRSAGAAPVQFLIDTFLAGLERS